MAAGDLLMCQWGGLRRTVGTLSVCETDQMITTWGGGEAERLGYCCPCWKNRTADASAADCILLTLITPTRELWHNCCWGCFVRIECGWNKTLSAETLEIEMIEIIQFVAPKKCCGLFWWSQCVCVCGCARVCRVRYWLIPVLISL